MPISLRSFLVSTTAAFVILLCPVVPGLAQARTVPAETESAKERPKVPVVDEDVKPLQEKVQDESAQPSLEANIPVADSSRTLLNKATGSQKEQVSCNPADCIVVPYQKEDLQEKIRDLMSLQAGKIMVQIDPWIIGLHDEEFEPLLTLMREASKRDGTVVIEPIYIGVRSIDILPIPAVKDILSATVGVVRRIINWVKFRHTGNYHAKVVYNPLNRTAILVYFVHKRYGDICTTLMSNCQDLEYLDDDTFDQMLSKSLQYAKDHNRTVRVTFDKTPARLPAASISVEDLRGMNQSARLYKWLLASRSAEKKQATRERFIPVAVVAAAIDYALTAYDLVKAAIMYAPARSMKAEVIYSGEESGGSIRTVTFTPSEN